MQKIVKAENLNFSINFSVRIFALFYKNAELGHKSAKSEHKFVKLCELPSLTPGNQKFLFFSIQHYEAKLCAVVRRTILCLYVPEFQRQVFKHVKSYRNNQRERNNENERRT